MRGKARSGVTTLRDVADAVGVSVATVSYALNGRRELVADATFARVLETAERLDYQPNRLMRAARTQRTEVIGVVIPSFRTTFFPDLVDAIETTLGAGGYYCVICQTHSGAELGERHLRTLRQRRVDGLIVRPKQALAELYRDLATRGPATVFIDDAVADVAIPSVRSDDTVGVALAVRHLAALGHTRIATLRQPDAVLKGSMRRRLENYREAMAAAGLNVAADLEYVVRPGYTFEAGHAVGSQILTSGAATALFAPADAAALGAMLAARDLGARVPDDLAVVGYGNQDAGRFIFPPLTTVDQQPAIIGRRAGELLLAMLAGEPPGPASSCLVQPQLIVRGSCGGRCEAMETRG